MKNASDEATKRAGDQGLQAAVERMAVPCELQALDEDDQGRLRVRGVMHSFGRTYSKRLLHPAGFANWLKRNPGARLPMLAQHGYQYQSAYSTIGEWDKIELSGGKAVWEGWIGQGTELQAETRSLVKQGLIKQLSWGWVVIKTAWVNSNDKDLDPHFEKILKENDWPEARAFIEYDVVEGSIVDVADDPGAKLAAALSKQIAELEGRMDKLAASELNEGVIVDLLNESRELKTQIAEFGAAREVGRTALEAGAMAVQPGIEELIENARTGLEEIKTDFQRWLEEARADLDNLKADLQAAWEADRFDEIADDVEPTDLPDGGADAPEVKPSADSTQLSGLIERVRRLGSSSPKPEP